MPLDMKEFETLVIAATLREMRRKRLEGYSWIYFVASKHNSNPEVFYARSPEELEAAISPSHPTYCVVASYKLEDLLT